MLKKADREGRTEPEWSDELRSAYDILGVDTQASMEEIRRAYLICVRTWHPDRFSRNPDRQRMAERATKQINAAYEFLCRLDGGQQSLRASSTRVSVRQGGRGNGGESAASFQQVTVPAWSLVSIVLMCLLASFLTLWMIFSWL